ncbi:MAG: hypothetical protein ACOX1P_22570 [Thermoguttaceae bacterium]
MKHQTPRFIRQFIRELSACRECGNSANLFDPICPHCGAGTPVKIPVSASVVVTAIAAQIAIVVLRIA